MTGVRRWVGALGAAVLLAGAGSVPAAAFAQAAPAPSPAPSNQVESVTFAHGVKSASLFGSGLLTPVDPARSFVATDVPYAVVRIQSLAPDTTVTMRLLDPTGATFTVQAKIPSHHGNPKEFDVAAPLYILGTDLETHTGNWHLQILLNDVPANDATFEWQPATAADLPKIKEAVDQSPLTADLHWRYGAALALLGRPSEGIAEVQNAIRLEATYGLYYLTLGRIYEQEGRTSDAIVQFQKVLDLHGSSYDTAFSNWARAHLAKLQRR